MTEIDCKAAYGGALPCSGNPIGALFMTLIYSLFIKHAVVFISNGADRLIDANIMPKNVVGGLVQPLLGATPLAILVVVSGWQDQVHLQVAIGAICGTAAALLSISSCVVLSGRCEVEEGRSIDYLLRDPWELMKTGVSTDPSISGLPWLLLAAAFLYLPVTIPDMLRARTMQPAYVISGTLCLTATAAYLTYQVLGPLLYQRSEQNRLHRFFRYNVVRSLSYYSSRYGGILLSDGSLNLQAIHRIFVRFDRDKDGLISREELAGMLIGMDFASSNDPQLLNAFIDTWFSHFAPEHMEGDRTLDPQVQNLENQSFPANTKTQASLPPGCISECGEVTTSLDNGNDEMESGLLSHSPSSVRLSPSVISGITEDVFVRVLQGWFEEKQRRFHRDFPCEDVPKQVKRSGGTHMWLLTKQVPEEGLREKLLAIPSQRSHDLRAISDEDIKRRTDETELPSSGLSCNTRVIFPAAAVETYSSHTVGAFLQLLKGFIICIIFSVPWCLSISNLASIINFPTFSVAFLVVPLVLLCPEVYAWLSLAGRRHSDTTSGILASVYSITALRTTLSLGLLFILFAARDENHEWDFTPEVLLVVLALIAVGTFAARNRTVMSWQALIIIWTFPLLLILTTIFRWTMHTSIPKGGY